MPRRNISIRHGAPPTSNSPSWRRNAAMILAPMGGVVLLGALLFGTVLSKSVGLPFTARGAGSSTVTNRALGHKSDGKAAGHLPSKAPARQAKVAPATTSAAHVSTTTTSPTTTTTAPSFATLYSQDSSGVVRIYNLTCPGKATGDTATGFLLSPNLIATADHVVSNSAAIGLTADNQTSVGQVIGYNRQSDLALIRSNSTFPGHVFSLAPSEPPAGSSLAVIGFPLGGPMSFTAGSVSGLNRSVTLSNGVTLTGLVQTDAAVNPGNSGGPVLNSTGSVIGLVEAADLRASGISYATPSGEAASQFAAWVGSRRGIAPVNCQRSSRAFKDNRLTVMPQAQGPDMNGVVLALSSFFWAINSRDFTTAYSQYSWASPDGKGLSRFTQGVVSSRDNFVTVRSIVPTTPNHAISWVTFRSDQYAASSPNRTGDTCDIWSVDYSMVRSNGTWKIINASGHARGPASTRCG